MAKNPENSVRFRVSAEVRAKWDAFIGERHITHQDAMEALISWFCSQDTLLQAMIVGQIAPKDYADVARIVTERLVQRASIKPGDFTKLMQTDDPPARRKPPRK